MITWDLSLRLSSKIWEVRSLPEGEDGAPGPDCCGEPKQKFDSIWKVSRGSRHPSRTELPREIRNVLTRRRETDQKTDGELSYYLIVREQGELWWKRQKRTGRSSEKKGWKGKKRVRLRTWGVGSGVRQWNCPSIHQFRVLSGTYQDERKGKSTPLGKETEKSP